MSTWTAENKTLAGNDTLLLEDSSHILLETGFYIVLEQSVPGSILWTAASKGSSSWSSTLKTGIDDVLGTEISDILISEAGDNIGLDQSDGTGVTWSGTLKS